jgi:hypothetical protein
MWLSSDLHELPGAATVATFQHVDELVDSWDNEGRDVWPALGQF